MMAQAAGSSLVRAPVSKGRPALYMRTQLRPAGPLMRPTGQCRLAAVPAIHQQGGLQNPLSSSSSGSSDSVHSSIQSAVDYRQALLPVPLLLLATGPAWAEEVLSDADAVYAAANGRDFTDVVVTFMAGTVFALLLLVTGGVAYLNIKGWLDDRQEKQDREAPVLTSSASSAPNPADPEVKKRVRVKREKRGFGSN